MEISRKTLFESATLQIGLFEARGVTDTCGMGLLLARMPWNRVGETSSPCCAVKPDVKGQECQS